MKAKSKRILKISLGVAGALFLFILLTFLFWLGPTVRLVAQRIGSKALGTPLTIDKLTINPRKGIIHLSDFTIPNPDTFGRSNAVSLASLDVSVDMGSVFSKTVTVHQVAINSPYFIYEQGSASDNINEFIRNVQAFVGFDPSAPPLPADPKKLAKKRKKQNRRIRKLKEEGPRVVVVESLTISDVQMHLANTEDQLLDFDVGFDELSVSMTNGSIRLDNFHVSNPGRLQTPNLFALEQLEILLDPESIYSSNINVQAVNIRKPHAFVEYNPETDTPGEFLKIAATLAAKIPTNAPKAEMTNEVVAADLEPVEPPPPPPEANIGTVTIEDVQCHVVNIGNPELSVYLGLEQLAVALDEGRINLNNLFFTNPKRLSTPNLFSLDGISIDFDADSLKADTLEISDVQVKNPYVFLELNKDSNTAAEFLKIANGFIERIPAYPVPQVPRPAADSSPEEPARESHGTVEPTAPPVALHNLLIDDIQVRMLDTTPTNNIPDKPHMLAGIGEISVRLVDGIVQVKDITVPNLPDYLATNIFHLENIDVELDPESLFSDQVVIDKVFINSPEVNLEQTGTSGNIAELQAQLMKLAPPAPTGGEQTAIQAESAETEKSEPIPLSEQPMLLHQLLLTNLAVNLKLPVDTNAPSGPMGMLDVGKLNPLDKVSLDTLNPLADESAEEELDPNAPKKLIAFDLLSLEPLKGLLSIKGLRVSNPPGFSRHDLVKMDEFRIDLDPDTLQADALVIEDILIDKPRIRYERQILSDNIKALQKEIEQATTGQGAAPDQIEEKSDREDTEKPEGEEEGQKVILDHILIARGMVHAKLSALPSIPVPLPNIELNDIGKETGGATVVEASTEVFDTFYEEMISAIGSTTGFAGDALKGVGALSFPSLGGTNQTAADEAEKAEEETAKKKKRRRPGARRLRRF